MIEEFVARFNSSRHPWVSVARDFLTRHPIIRSCIRLPLAILRGNRSSIRRAREKLWFPIDRKTMAIMDARALGGAVTVQELERLWDLGAVANRALCIGDGTVELAQIETILRRAGTCFVAKSSMTAGVRSNTPDPTGYDLVVCELAVSAGVAAAALKPRLRADQQYIEIYRGTSRRSEHHGRVLGQRRAQSSGTRSLRQKLSAFEPLNVVLLNDVGFQYGAGNALKRQAASFLLNGWNVAAVTWRPGLNDGQPAITGLKDLGNWKGIHGLQDTHIEKGFDQEAIITKVAGKIHSLGPDIVVVGNIHGANWPIGILRRLQESSTKIVAYMHDCYWITGRCAYPGTCTRFVAGCNETCPTAHEYPRLEPEKIIAAWQERADVFLGPSGVPLIANSRWTRDMAVKRFGNAARTDVVHLGLDHDLFAPISRASARRLLKLPENKTVVVMGAVDLRSPWKGGVIFQSVHQALIERDDIAVVLFGQSSQDLSSARSFGLVQDERLMPFILSAADIFVGTATIEAFGQTLMEASACGVPVVAFRVGGVEDAVIHGRTGLLVDEISADPLLEAVETLVSDPARRQTLGQNGRAHVEQHFTLAHQGKSWVECLKKLS